MVIWRPPWLIWMSSPDVLRDRLAEAMSLSNPVIAKPSKRAAGPHASAAAIKAP